MNIELLLAEYRSAQRARIECLRKMLAMPVFDAKAREALAPQVLVLENLLRQLDNLRAEDLETFIQAVPVVIAPITTYTDTILARMWLRMFEDCEVAFSRQRRFSPLLWEIYETSVKPSITRFRAQLIALEHDAPLLGSDSPLTHELDTFWKGAQASLEWLGMPVRPDFQAVITATAN